MRVTPKMSDSPDAMRNSTMACASPDSSWTSTIEADIASGHGWQTPGPRVVQVERERDPPHEIVEHAENPRCDGPRPPPDQDRQAHRTQDLAEKSDHGQEPSTLGHPRDFEVEKAVQPDDHPEARKDRRVVQGRHPGETEQPLRVEGGEHSKPDVVQPGGREDGSMKSAARDHDERSTRVGCRAVHGHAPFGKPPAAYISRTPERKTPAAMTPSAQRSTTGMSGGVMRRSVGRSHHVHSTGTRMPSIAP